MNTFEQILQEYMRGVIDDDRAVADPRRASYRKLDDESVEYLDALYDKLIKED